MRYFNIPIFIPELACPFQCVFCNQHNISGQLDVPKSDEITAIIESHLTTLPRQDCRIEIAFFGGSFTGLELQQQNRFLELAKPFLLSKGVHGIRISTRPDYINREILENLQEKGVTAIELGAQSLNDTVLTLSGRGHNAAAIEYAAAMIREFNFELGLQMMIGLPGDNFENSLYTARKIIELGADTTRIYPCLVIKGTQLEKSYKQNKYIPLTMEDAVEQTALIYLEFIEAGVKVLRMGLHPSETFAQGGLLGGPFHPAFGEMVLTRVWQLRLEQKIPKNTVKGTSIKVAVHPSQLNAAIGFKAKNKKWLHGLFHKVYFEANADLVKTDCHVDTC
jgi:histone acetyltransferase (RNA polymerase elongator complex component)